MLQRAFLLFSLAFCGYCSMPNTCKTFRDYRNMKNNPNCWYNPDINLNTVEFAQKHGYPIERYRIVTKDGYILDMFRMPQNRVPRGVIFLQHPAFTCSSVWVDKGNFSLAFQIYSEGYEVWLPNSRGNRYGRKHIKISPNNPKFWDYGYDEMIRYDVPAQLEVLQKVTNAGPEVTFIGHSLGGTYCLLLQIIFPTESRGLIKAYLAASPGTTFKHNRVPFRTLFSLSGDFMLNIARNLNLLEIFPPFFRSLVQSTCARNSAIEICAQMIYWMMGPSLMDEANPEWLPILFSQQPAGMSMKVILHYFMNGRDGGRFQAFNYGPIENLKRYNSTKPPLYPVEDIHTPIYFISGGKDTLCTWEDTQEIFEKLRKDVQIFGHKIYKNFNHLDFLYGKNIQIFNDDVISFLNKIY